MNALTFSGVFLLLFFSLSSADICTNVSDTNSKVFQCNAEFSQRSSTACEGNCRSELEHCRSEQEQYADDCLGDSAQVYKDAITAVCGEGSSAAGIGSTTLLTTVSALLFAVYTAFM
jgi:hypothetical protein